MQCRVCGAPLPSGASACPTCGTAVQDANQYGSQTPATNYGTVPPPSPFGGPYNQGEQPASPYNQNPGGYNQGGQPASPYNQNPGAYNQGGQPSSPYNQNPGAYNQAGQPSYPSSPYNQANNFQAGGAPPYPGMQPGGVYGPPPRKKSRVGLIIGIIAVVLILACVGSLLGLAKIGANVADTAPPTVANSATPTNTNSKPADGASPSGTPIDPQASVIIIDPKVSSAIDKKTLEPPAGSIKAIFKVNDPIYVSFHLDPNKYNLQTEKAYVNVRFYRGTQSILKDDPLPLDKEETVGYFGAKYYLSTRDGAAEVYWCHKADCSDGKLAQVVRFIVTN